MNLGGGCSRVGCWGWRTGGWS